MYGYSEFRHSYSKSAFKYERPLSEKYRVFVNGEEIPVYTCRISKFPFNTVWPGHQRPFDQTEEASFVNIVSDEELLIEVMTELPHERVLIKPYSRGISHTEENGVISFSLKENGSFVLECDSYHNSLYIFNSRPISAPAPESVTYYFEPGIHFPGKLILKSNESVYIDRDALVYGCIYAENAENIRIFGNGILDDSHEERTGNYCYESFTNGNMRFYDCKGVSVEGVGMMNSAQWCFSVFGCLDFDIRDIKIFGQWRYNCDGIDIVNSQRICIRDSFIHSFDDTISIKGVDRHCLTDCRDIHVDGCTLWCDWGRCCEVGVETACREYRDISFRNCDILRGGCVALDIADGDCAEMFDIVFENINIEYNSFDTVEVYQGSDDMKYGAEDTMAVPVLFRASNREWRSPENILQWGLPPLSDALVLDGIASRSIHDITVRNIRVYYDEGLPLVDGEPDIKIEIFNEPGTDEFYSISISDIMVNGRPIPLADKES